MDISPRDMATPNPFKPTPACSSAQVYTILGASPSETFTQRNAEILQFDKRA